MKIIVTGSLGNISKPLTTTLVQQGHQVTVISSQAARTADIEALGATPAIGTLYDQDFLTTVFTGADLVYTMIPPVVNFFDPQADLLGECRKISESYRAAIAASGVKRVIHLSSIGAHMQDGNGLLALHTQAENILGQLADVDITFMRPTGFYYTLYHFIGMIKQQGFIAANYGGNDQALYVAPADIATAIATEIAEAPQHRKIVYVNSEERTFSEVATILGTAIGKPDLQWHTISNEAMLEGVRAAGMPPPIAEGYVEMFDKMHTGVLQQDYFLHRPAQGTTKLHTFAIDFATAYQQQ